MSQKTEISTSLQSDKTGFQLINENDKNFLWETSAGERVFRHNNSIIVELPPGRSTLTTSWLNGGYREDLRYIYNHQAIHECDDSHEATSLEGGCIEAYTSIIAEKLGLDPSCSTGLLTAANMRNVAISTHSFR